MKLVEVVRTIATSDETIDAVFDFARSLGKEPIRDRRQLRLRRQPPARALPARRRPRARGGRRRRAEDIDKGMELGCGHPMGPLKLLDFVGLDTTYAIAEIMFDEYREKRFAPPPLLKRMVLAGRFGKKSGRGLLRVRRKKVSGHLLSRDRGPDPDPHGQPARQAERAERRGHGRARRGARRGAAPTRRCGVVIVTGAGEKSFIAGADIGELSKLSPVEGREHARAARPSSPSSRAWASP